MSQLEHNDLDQGKSTKVKQNKGNNSSLVSLSVTFVVFVALPYELYVSGMSLIGIFAITIFVAGLLSDVFTTKIGFNRGYGDYNVFYNAAERKKVGKSKFLAGALIFGLIRALIMFYFWQDPIILLITATMSLIGPLWNSIILSSADRTYSLKQPNIESPTIVREINSTQ